MKAKKFLHNEVLTPAASISNMVYQLNEFIEEDESLSYIDSRNTNGGIASAVKFCGTKESFAFSVSKDIVETCRIRFVSEDNRRAFFGRYFLDIFASLDVWEYLFPNMSTNDILGTVEQFDRKQVIDLVFSLKKAQKIVCLENKRSELFKEANKITAKIREMEKI